MLFLSLAFPQGTFGPHGNPGRSGPPGLKVSNLTLSLTNDRSAFLCFWRALQPHGFFHCMITSWTYLIRSLWSSPASKGNGNPVRMCWISSFSISAGIHKEANGESWLKNQGHLSSRQSHQFETLPTPRYHFNTCCRGESHLRLKVIEVVCIFGAWFKSRICSNAPRLFMR